MAVMRAWVAAAVACTACGADTPVISAVVDTPPAGSQAYPWTDVDTLLVTVTEDGEPRVEASFARGEAISLAGVPLGPDVAIHYTGLTGGREVSYGRTCTFDTTGDAVHLWFSHIVRWGEHAAPSDASRTRGFGFTDDEGGAAFLGGATADIHRFDPRTGAFTVLDLPTLRREQARLARFTARSAVIVGGVDLGGTPVLDVEVVTPTAEASAQVQTIQFADLALTGHAVEGLVGEGALVVGGNRDGEPFSRRAFVLSSGAAGLPEVRAVAGGLAIGRAGHTATRMGDELGADVIVIGGRDASGALTTAELFDPLSEAFAAGFTPQSLPRFDHTSIRLPDDSILVLGGWSAPGVPVREIEVYDPHLGEFRVGAELPGGAGVVGMTATALTDGRILVSGGLDENDVPVGTTYLVRFDPISGGVDISATDPLNVPRAHHAAALLCDGTVLVVGGADSAIAERYNPPSASRL